jgi:phosphoserine phosphatase RsbU/P
MTSNSPALHLERVGAREILDALADGAYITDCDRRIVFWSRAAERITGWSAKDVVGHRCADNLLVHADKDGHQLCSEDCCPLYRAIVTGEQSTESLLVFAQHKEGHRVPVEVSVAPLRDAAGQVVGGVEVFRDLTVVMKDLQRAKAIQDHALESELPADDRVRFDVSYRPEELVGGDFYRVEMLDPNRYAVIVADVMGHGIASALYTMQLRSIWEECRHELASPARFLSELNRRLHHLAGPDGYFATAFCLLLDAASGRLLYVRAGHPSPFLFRAGGKAETLAERSPAVGLRPSATFKETEACLAPGDSLLLFTDGAIEITNAQDQELGESGFLRLLQKVGTAKLDLGSVEQRLLEFSNRIRLPDDLTLLQIHLQRCGAATIPERDG